MNAFALREKVVGEYAQYVKGFLRVYDPDLRQFAEQQLREGRLWPEPLLQLNPAYERGATLDELADQGVIHPDTARFFQRRGRTLRLYRHQEEALHMARQGRSYVVTTGTGSGKSLTYLVPIVDWIVRHPRKAFEEPAVRAILVYPMNALINSQEAALATLVRDYERAYGPSPVRFAKYTGETSLEERHAIWENPPDILLTNFMMLELMLVRAQDRRLVDAMRGNLQFLVLDEIHTYRGRQGADVAMLARRVRLAAANDALIAIGTSATLISEGSRDDRRDAAARVASRLFGIPFDRDQVIDEALQRITTVPAPTSRDALRAAVEAPLPPEGDVEAFRQHPLAAWVEAHFGVTEDAEGRLVRHQPVSVSEAAATLARETGLPQERCREQIEAVLALGNATTNEEGEPLFAFRLHQFLAGGATIYATLDEPGKRQFTARAQSAVEDPQGQVKPVYPILFCRHCGQDYYAVRKAFTGDDNAGGDVVLIPLAGEEADADDDEAEGAAESSAEGRRAGYWVADPTGELWDEDDTIRLPDAWLQFRQDGTVRVSPSYRRHLPEPLWVYPDGRVAPEGAPGAVRGWLLPKPFRLCLRCGVAYTTRRNEFAKLGELGQAGRSTATTVVAKAILDELRAQLPNDPKAHKLMSFTDSRQDASLQAGHFNDFVLMARLRAALVKALESAPGHVLGYDELADAVMQALGLEPAEYTTATEGPALELAQKALRDVLEYLLYADLAYGWRFVQPNLEQVGLLEVGFIGLEDFCQDHPRWDRNAILQTATPEKRCEVIRALLDYMRQELALTAPVFDPREQDRIKSRAAANLRPEWQFKPEYLGEHMLGRRMFVTQSGGHRPTDRIRRLTPRSALGRYLSRASTWGLARHLADAEVEQLIGDLVAILEGTYLERVREHHDEGFRVRHAMLQWRLGSGTPPKPNPVRQARMRDAAADVSPPPIHYFLTLYRQDPSAFRGLEAREHTGQVAPDRRVEREKRFNDGTLPLLCCSPTMELGIDIRELSVVHMRNLPPTPANYAQRSGRAGRGGQQALVVAFAAQKHSHDQYYFDRPERMVAGAVAPPAFDLTNEDLVRSHIQAMWLAATGINLGDSMAYVLDINADGQPLRPEAKAQAQLSPERRQALEDQVKALMDSLADELKGAPWYTPGWVKTVLDQAPLAFDRAFERWRALYQHAKERYENLPSFEQADPNIEHDRRQALEERELLLNNRLLGPRQRAEEAEFYPYRYLASAGFLPGYNFPRLPVYLWVQQGDKLEIIERPRFLGLSEFGPLQIVYHEGQHHRVCFLTRRNLSSAALRLVRFCQRCRHVVPDTAQGKLDRCPECRALLDGNSVLELKRPLEMQALRAFPRARITCDEEVRRRRHFNIGTYYAFGRGHDGRLFRQTAEVRVDGEPWLRLTYGPQATIWWINQGEQETRYETSGFALDLDTGEWVPPSKVAAARNNEGVTKPERNIVTEVYPYVTDTRNIMLVRIAKTLLPDASPFRRKQRVITFGQALGRAIRVMYELEEQELAVETIDPVGGTIMLWEAAEGGLGILARLVRDPKAFGEVARVALETLHFDPQTGDDREVDEGEDRCVQACYRCLMSYSNQSYHMQLDRHLVRDMLLGLQRAVTVETTRPSSTEADYKAARARVHPASPIEGKFLDRLWETRRVAPKPEHVHFLVPDVQVEADFYFETDDGPVCVLCHGKVHDHPVEKEKDKERVARLQAAGYRVIEIRYDDDIDAILAEHSDVWGPERNCDDEPAA